MKGDTICALCTPEGKGAISLIRISGPQALEITRKIAKFLPQKPESHQIYFGDLKQRENVLDQALISYFVEGRSFTGEESLEISCHGGDIYKGILKALLENGARLAERGEFSLQAFSNGKMDLVQAEGLLQLIESQNDIARRQALSQLKGKLSKKLQNIEKKWTFLLSHLEADIDFSLENLNTLQDSQIKEKIKEIEEEISNLLSSYCPFERLQKGLVFGLFGLVNSGKSSLLNALLREEKAIVSSEEGTTRDIVEGLLENSKGLNITLKDSAGFRKSESEGEKRGQEKSKELFLSCDYKLILLDSTLFHKQKLEKFLFQDPLKTLLVFTKKDLSEKHLNLKALRVSLQEKLKKATLPPLEQIFFISSLTGEGLEALRKKLFSFGDIQKQDFVISNYRHYKGLKVMEKSLEKSLSLLENAQGERDLMALELRRGLLSLYEILGKQIDDQVLDCIFKEFCIGK